MEFLGLSALLRAVAVSYDETGIDANLGVIGTVGDPLRPVLDVGGGVAGLNEHPVAVKLFTRLEPVAGIGDEVHGVHGDDGLAGGSGEPKGALSADIGYVGLGIGHAPRDPLPPLVMGSDVF